MSTQHWKKIMIGIGMSTLLLGACGGEEAKEEKKDTEEVNTDEELKNDPATDEAASLTQMTEIVEDAGALKEAENIPAEEKTAITDAFNQYIDAFNAEDFESYMSVISKTPVNFKYADEERYVKQIFDSVDSKRSVENVKIINYAGKKADVYAEIQATTKDPNSEKEVTRSGKQVTVFHKKDDGWKVAAIFFLASKEDQENNE
ncbi:nuclear transport factor 2 family protein [Rossellomorea aquimaris]|uniref:nuclear transport factor 2 family protein n=1 Tax=Rossellomorea aquimaris TaxID=189382 RepID=UPI001CD529A8|nr:nuclear transport factor 2 family protein [Rossellomorea aquimaris]MCA1055179.1 nuclear transport factor 2 family protein [Rossellomorea aquimaris]